MIKCRVEEGAVVTTLSWTYSETGGVNGEMIIYVNSINVISSTTTGSGSYTIYQGDTIYVTIQLLSAGSGNDDGGNVYTQSSKGTLVDASCFQATIGTLTTATYTVLAGDVGTTITLDALANCGPACL